MGSSGYELISFGNWQTCRFGSAPHYNGCLQNSLIKQQGPTTVTIFARRSINSPQTAYCDAIRLTPTAVRSHIRPQSVGPFNLTSLLESLVRNTSPALHHARTNVSYVYKQPT
jgi:hypothetical protein